MIGQVLSALASMPGVGIHPVQLADFEPPSIFEFLPDGFLFVGTPFEMNRFMIIRIAAVLIILLVFGLTAKKAKVIPGKFQSCIEMLLGFVRENIVENTFGKERGERFVPMITTIFCSIAVFNLMGIVPGFNMAATAAIGLPMIFALWDMYAYWKVGIQEQGLFHFLRNETLPKGIPWFVYILYAPIELAQLFIIRPFSLTIRLFANMLAGHILIGLCMAGSNYLFMEVGFAMKPLGIVTFLATVFFICFEILVGILQAYVFALLSASYINLSFAHEAVD